MTITTRSLIPSSQIAARRFDQQVKVVAHETPGVNLPIGLLTGFPQGRKVQVAVIVVSEDWLAPIAAIHHVVNCPCVLNSQLARHRPWCSLERIAGKSSLMDTLSK